MIRTVNFQGGTSARLEPEGWSVSVGLATRSGLSTRQAVDMVTPAVQFPGAGCTPDAEWVRRQLDSKAAEVANAAEPASTAYAVTWHVGTPLPGGEREHSRVVVTEGYSTVADIPRILATTRWGAPHMAYLITLDAVDPVDDERFTPAPGFVLSDDGSRYVHRQSTVRVTDGRNGILMATGQTVVIKDDGGATLSQYLIGADGTLSQIGA